MAFLRKKEIPPGSGNYYWYLVENYRDNGKVRQRVLEYRGKNPGELPEGSRAKRKERIGTTQTPKQNVDLTGLADREGVKSSDVSQAELKKGIKVEMEHTKDPQVAEQIATDHLTEIPDYYTRLDRMEKQAKRVNKIDNPQNDINKFQDEIANEKKEYGGIFTPEGKKISQFGGISVHSVNLTDQKDKLKGNILVHNHPSDYTFSRRDLIHAQSNEIKEIRAIGPNYTYIASGLDDKNKVYNIPSTNRRAIKETGDTKEGQHKAWVITAKESGFKYRRIKTKNNSSTKPDPNRMSYGYTMTSGYKPTKKEVNKFNKLNDGVNDSSLSQSERDDYSNKRLNYIGKLQKKQIPTK